MKLLLIILLLFSLLIPTTLFAGVSCGSPKATWIVTRGKSTVAIYETCIDNRMYYLYFEAGNGEETKMVQVMKTTNEGRLQTYSCKCN